MIDKLTYGVIYLFSKMPFFILYRISDFVAFLLNHVIGYRKEVILENLRNSFPEKSEEEIKKIWVQFNKNFSDQMVETLKMFTISKKELSKRLVYDNPEILTRYAKEGRSIMVCTAHYGNWEYAIGFPFTIPGFDAYNVVYAPIENKYINNRIIETRERFGIELMSMKETMQKIRKQPNHGIVYGFLFDQSPHKSRVKYDLLFLNQITPVHLGTENVSKMKNAVVIYLNIHRIKRGYYKATPTLITEKPNETPQYEITKQIFKKLEEIIKDDPSQWLWSHRRWKYQPGRDYNLEKDGES